MCSTSKKGIYSNQSFSRNLSPSSCFPFFTYFFITNLPWYIRTRHMGKKKMNKIRSNDSLPMTHHFFVFLIATYKMTVVKHPFRAPSWGLKVDPPSRSSVKKYVWGKLTMGVIKHVEKTRRTRAWRAYHMECKTKSKF